MSIRKRENQKSFINYRKFKIMLLQILKLLKVLQITIFQKYSENFEYFSIFQRPFWNTLLLKIYDKFSKMEVLKV